MVVTGDIAGDESVTMHYGNVFRELIRDVHWIDIVGWPQDLAFVNLNAFSEQQLCRILTSCCNGSMHFTRISLVEWAQLKETEGEIVRRERKVRDDIGIRRRLRVGATRGRKRRPGSDVKTPRYVQEEDM